jgi:hypothetical protein
MCSIQAAAQNADAVEPYCCCCCCRTWTACKTAGQEPSSPVLQARRQVVSWQNQQLNPEQRAAVHSVVGGDHAPLPMIIYGPPGTGKTSTLIEAATQVGRCAPAVLHDLRAVGGSFEQLHGRDHQGSCGCGCGWPAGAQDGRVQPAAAHRALQQRGRPAGRAHAQGGHSAQRAGAHQRASGGLGEWPHDKGVRCWDG